MESYDSLKATAREIRPWYKFATQVTGHHHETPGGCGTAFQFLLALVRRALDAFVEFGDCVASSAAAERYPSKH